ncbi:MAG: ADP-ribosylglycohydrolase [Halioglobus sp.]|jgi:ADP-ribosylglycohydrolase
MSKNTEIKIVNSALWAAYGDVLGFPTELVSETDFKKRNSIEKIISPIHWTKRVGGMFGPDVNFPAGSYSDDTQLRLSTSRAIRGDGFFDVESFAKIELPVWLNYALGAGRGSKAAAANLALKESTWSQNFFNHENSCYWEGGGNGAAMRIQPHVWLGYAHGIEAIIPDVVRNTVCTHGHPRAIIGAAIHATFLLAYLTSGSTIPPSAWDSLGVDAASLAYDFLVTDEELSLVWVPNWERLSNRKLKDVWAETISEWVGSAQSAMIYCSKATSKEATYRKILTELGGFSSAERGSGLKTPLYATVLSWLYKDENPEDALLLSANTFKSDTDSIATMAGALIGSISNEEPAGPIQDFQYIKSEAARLYSIGAGNKAGSFEYPDLLSWFAPKTQSDAFVVEKGNAFLSGIGQLKLSGEEFRSQKGNKLLWQWSSLPFGQTVLIKRRDIKYELNSVKEVESPNTTYTLENNQAIKTSSERKIKSAINFEILQMSYDGGIGINDRTRECIRSGFDPKIIGEHLLALSSGIDGIEKVIAFAAIIAKAKMARSNK